MVLCFLQRLGYGLRAGSLVSPLCDKNSWCSLLLVGLQWLWRFSCLWPSCLSAWMKFSAEQPNRHRVGTTLVVPDKEQMFGAGTLKRFCCQVCPARVNPPVLAQQRSPRKSFRKASPSAVGRFFTAKLCTCSAAFWHFNQTGKKRAVQLFLWDIQ